MISIKLVFKIALLIIGLIMVAWFVLPAILTGNVHIGNYTSIAVGIVLSIYGLFFSKFNSLLANAWSYVLGKCIIIALGIAIIAICVLAILCIISMSQAKNSVPKEDSTLIVLGCRVHSYGPSVTLQGRLDVAITYLKANPGSGCIVCGGQGKDEPVTEASVMYAYLTEKGIDSSRIYIEDKSKDTLENLTNAYEIININQLNRDVTIVTNDYHLYRARQYALSAGYTSPSMLGSDTLWWLFPSLVVREMYGILELWFLR